jgi:hypothetical protein
MTKTEQIYCKIPAVLLKKILAYTKKISKKNKKLYTRSHCLRDALKMDDLADFSKWYRNRKPVPRGAPVKPVGFRVDKNLMDSIIRKRFFCRTAQNQSIPSTVDYVIFKLEMFFLNEAAK